ncbi:uncharacterized protein LOC114183315 [Vigna unguiculata]|uniref:uncharacterized protein LOC114183315 n=1 Tax=Vigna unguiculata TaxID=3917 RepID=UPI0010164D2B|nr:uncharacterized protein LOC114183315 [Vigna unguiculata]
MEGNMSDVVIPLFDGESYDLWAVRMQTYLEGLDLWEVGEEDDVPLFENPTVAQMQAHKDKKTRKEYLKAEYEGNKKIRGMKVLNLIREFEMQRMKELKTIKEYSNKLLGIANKIKLLGNEFSDSRLVEKILVTMPER